MSSKPVKGQQQTKCYGRSTVVSDLDGWGFVLNVRWRKLARAGL
jgi:hypothetical protein